MTGAPYGVELSTFLNPLGMPCWNPPYGSMTAYDLKTGERLWDVPFGQVQKWGFYMPESWGSVTIGGPVVTASGLVFAGASMDSRVRALDLATGEVLWKGLVDAPAVALPAVYAYKAASTSPSSPAATRSSPPASATRSSPSPCRADAYRHDQAPNGPGTQLVPKPFQSPKKWQATFQPLSSRIPAPENDAFSAACFAIAELGDSRANSPRKPAPVRDQGHPFQPLTSGAQPADTVRRRGTRSPI